MKLDQMLEIAEHAKDTIKNNTTTAVAIPFGTSFMLSEITNWLSLISGVLGVLISILIFIHWVFKVKQTWEDRKAGKRID